MFAMAQVRYFLHFNKEALDRLKEDPNFFSDPDNRVPIKFGLTINKKRLKLTTRLFINPNNWDKHRRKVTNKEPYADYINDTLQLIQEKVFKMSISARSGDKPGTYEYFKEELTCFIEMAGDETVIGKDTQAFFLKTFEEFLDDSTDKGDSTIRNYRNTLSQLKRFCQKYDQALSFSNINKAFVDKLLRFYFKDLRITRNTAGKHLKNLRAFLKDSYDKKYHANKYFEEIEVYKDKSSIIFLKPEEVRAIRDIELNRRVLDESRDIFLFGVYTGLRHSDIIRINRSMVDGDFLNFIAKKTQNAQRTYINKHAKRLLEKYDYCMPTTSVQVVNRHLQEIAKLATLNREVTITRYIGRDPVEEVKPIYDVITTHVAKKTFVTLYFQQGGRMETLMQSTGNTDRETMKHYLKMTSKGEKDEIDRIMDELDF